MGYDRDFMDDVAQLPDASQKPTRYELMAKLMATYSAATKPVEPVEDAERTDMHGDGLRGLLQYLAILVRHLNANTAIAVTAAQTVESAAYALVTLSEYLELADQDVLSKELRMVAMESREAVDKWAASQKSPEPTKPE